MTVDAANLPELTRRQEQILTLIVQTYTETTEPIGSKFLADHFELGVSPATIRNEMAALEELGYVIAPHTSAGRIPTESGYRYFVKRLITASELTSTEQEHIARKFHSLPIVTEQWMHFAATTLARTAQIASLVTPPSADTSLFQHIELIAIQGRLVLMVLVLQGGVVHQRMLNVAEPVPQETLSDAATRINTTCAGLTSSEVHMKSTQQPALEHDVLELAAELMERADSTRVRVIYRDGLSEIIGAFPDSEGAQQAIRVYEERAFLNMILAEVMRPFPDGDSIQVVIAGEGRWDELNRLSMVLTHYGIPGQASGAIGVLGPTHINYGRAISAVRYVSGLMTGMLAELYHDQATHRDQSLPD